MLILILCKYCFHVKFYLSNRSIVRKYTVLLPFQTTGLTAHWPGIALPSLFLPISSKKIVPSVHCYPISSESLFTFFSFFALVLFFFINIFNGKCRFCTVIFKIWHQYEIFMYQSQCQILIFEHCHFIKFIKL